MGTLLEILVLIAGFGLLIKGADIFVESCVNVAEWLKIPNIVIGLTIVAMGTSTPEIVFNVSAAIRGYSDMAVGNIVGSNIFNLLFIMGFCAMIQPVAVKLKEILRDFSIGVGAAVLLLIMMFVFGDVIPRIGGFALLAIFIVYMTYFVRVALKNRCEEEISDKVEGCGCDNGSGIENCATVENGNALENGGVVKNGGDGGNNRRSIAKNIFVGLFGLVIIVAGGQLAVTMAVNIAFTFGITERVVGLTILAIGTSMPELVTSIVACKKGKADIAIGNIVGSSIFNILFILGITGLIIPLATDSNMIFDLTFLIIGSLLFLLFAYTGKKVVRSEGLLMVAAYAVYMVSITLM